MDVVETIGMMQMKSSIVATNFQCIQDVKVCEVFWCLGIADASSMMSMMASKLKDKILRLRGRLLGLSCKLNIHALPIKTLKTYAQAVLKHVKQIAGSRNKSKSNWTSKNETMQPFEQLKHQS